MIKNKEVIYAGPMMDNRVIYWDKPRKLVEQNIQKMEHIHSEGYFFGMLEEESAFLAGLIREEQPKKILEVGVNKGGTTLIIIETLRLLDLDSALYSVDIDENFHGLNLLKDVSRNADNLHIRYGRDVSAYLEEIGSDIDFCILDTAHFLPGELLNFLCILPYLKLGATVVVHDQTHHFDADAPYPMFWGPSSIIACRVLFDTVTAEKLVPNFMKDSDATFAPNIAAFTITEDTYKNVRDILSALMLPWRVIPEKDYLTDVITLLEKNYHHEYIEYFKHIISRQLKCHLIQSSSAKSYWEALMRDLYSRYKQPNIAFYGGGGYCENLITTVLPKELHPVIILDSVKDKGYIGSVEIKNIVNWANDNDEAQ